jgi:ABC-type glycerol-3-phosphate transport system permease component
MGNNEILQGKTLPDLQRNDVFLADSVPGLGMLAGTVNGELYLYSLERPKDEPRYLNLGYQSTSYSRNGQDLWVASADGGISLVDLAAWQETKHWDWGEIQERFEATDFTPFMELPGEIFAREYGAAADQFNRDPLVEANEGASLSEVTGIRFSRDASLLDSLNRILLDQVMLAKTLEEWKKVPSWFNPVIPWLYKQERTPQKDRELFRWCLAERFPGNISRFLQVPWTDVWVNRIPGSGHGTSITPCGNGQICFALWWDDFPGVGVLDPKTGSVRWITAQHGLSSTAIQHLVRISDREVLAITDAGLNLVDVVAHKVSATFLFGEYGLKYLDGRDVTVARLDSANILLGYGQEVMAFNFRRGEGKSLAMPMFRSITSDITALEVDSVSAFIGTSEGVLVVDKMDWVNAPEDASENEIPILLYSKVFESNSTHEATDAVVHTIKSDAGVLRLGGLFGFASSIDRSSHRTYWHQQVPEGRFQLHWRNYEDLWKTIPFGRFLRNSLVICLSVMFISVLVAALASYAIVRFEFPGKRLLSMTILATQMVPGILYLIPIFILFTTIQQYVMIEMVNTWHGIILVYSAFFIPMSTWILRGFFASIPRELEEAAMIDGCSPFGAFIRITIPAALPGIVATGIYVFLLAWDELMFAWVLCTDTSTATIPVGIRLYVGQFGNRFDLLMAAATVATLPVMVLFFLMQRHIVSGLTGGAVKG